MPISFPSTVANIPARKGQLAAPKQFGPDHRFSVAPVHTRFDAVEWFVWDAETTYLGGGRADVIRQAATLAEAIDGLDL